jgi:transketolase C-terminal domain/subunit
VRPRDRNVFTVEEHSINGGLGSTVARGLVRGGFCGKFKRIGLPTSFAVLGDPTRFINSTAWTLTALPKRSATP